VLDPQERHWATLAHLCGLLWFSGVPFAGTIGAAIVFVTKRHVSSYVADQTREAQNFQNTVALAVAAIVTIAGTLLGSDMIATLRTGRSDLDVGQATAALWVIVLMALALAAIMLANAACSILAAVAAHRGEPFRYPVCLRLLRASKSSSAASSLSNSNV
jgi:uncharacterized protein